MSRSNVLWIDQNGARETRICNFDQRRGRKKILVTSYCDTVSVTAGLKCHMGSLNWRYVSRGHIPSSNMLWIDQNGAREAEIHNFDRMRS